jgi:hypothetical protein
VLDEISIYHKSNQGFLSTFIKQFSTCNLKKLSSSNVTTIVEVKYTKAFIHQPNESYKLQLQTTQNAQQVNYNKLV